MANVFTDLPAPAGNGAGATADTTDLGRIRTITCQGAFRGTVSIEVSLDGGTNWSPTPVLFTSPGKQTIEIAGNAMRVVRTGVPTINPGLPNVDVGADDAGGEYDTLAAPAGDGNGASTDISAHGSFHTIQVTGPFRGTVNLQISEDGNDWATVATFDRPGIKSEVFVAQFARVQRTGTPTINPGTPTVRLAAINNPVAAEVVPGQNGAVITPEDFDAVGDGVTDDTQALQDWLDAAEGADTQLGVVLQARGEYAFTGELLLAPTGSSNVILDLYGAKFLYTGANGVVVDDLEVTFDSATKTVTRSSGTWAADGIVSGRRVFFWGGDSNRKIFNVTDVTGAVMTVDPTDTVTDEGPVTVRVEQFRNALTIGDPYAAKKLFFSTIMGIYLLASNKTAVNALYVAHADFLTIREGVVGCSFGRSVFVPGAAGNANSIGTANGLGVFQLQTPGGEHETALLMSNAWNWIGGKLQQSNAADGVGLRVYRSGAFTLKTVDFSIHEGGGIYVERCSAGELTFYSEDIGPADGADTVAVCTLDNSNGIVLNNALVNCAQGSIGSGLHAAYGVHLANGSYDCSLGIRGVLPRLALVLVDADCGPNELPAVASCTHRSDDTQPFTGPIIDRSGRLINNAQGKYRRPYAPVSATNYVDPDLTTWTLTGGAALVGSITSEDGESSVRVVDFPTPGTSRIEYVSGSVVGATINGVRVRVKARLVSINGAPSTFLPILSVVISSNVGAVTARGQFRIGENFDWFETYLTAADGALDGTYDVFIEARSGYESFRVAIEDIEMQVIEVADPAATFLDTYPIDGDDMALVTGAPVPDAYWVASNLSGAVLDRSTSGKALTKNSVAIEQGVDDTATLLTQVAVFDDSQAQKFTAPANTDFDVSTGSFALLLVCRATGVLGTRYFAGKRGGTAAANAGYAIIGAGNGNMQVEIADGSVEAGPTATAVDWSDGNPMVIFVVRDTNAGTLAIYVRKEGVTRSASVADGTNDLSNSDTFSIGAFVSTLNPDLYWAAAAFWSGANAEGLDAAVAVALAQYIGLE